MEETAYRILDTLSRELGNPLSINELTGRIRRAHGTAYYANTYRALHALAEEGAIILTKTGKSSIASLNFRNYLLQDLLTEMELRRKRDLLRKNKGLQILIVDLDSRIRNMRYIDSISLVNPEKSLPLNRLDFLILLNTDDKDSAPSDYSRIYDIIRQLQSMHNIKLDPLTLTFDELLELLTSDEINPLREMLSGEIAFYSPNNFWNRIAVLQGRLHWAPLAYKEISLAKTAEHDLVYNLARFGYKEMGAEIKEGRKICVEYVITAIMISNDARRINAIPVMLAKNKAKYSLLIFLSLKYGLEGRLLGILRALDMIKPTRENEMAIRILESLKTAEIQPDVKSIQENMRLYSAA